MPSLTASLLSTVLPVLLCVLVMMALFSHAGVYWSKWEDVRSLYLDSFNRTEVPLLVVFFVFLFLSCLAAYLHVYVSLVYTFAVFVAFNTLLVSARMHRIAITKYMLEYDDLLELALLMLSVLLLMLLLLLLCSVCTL